MKKLMCFMVMMLIFGMFLGCDQINKMFGTSVTPEQALSVLAKAEAFYPVLEASVAKYVADNPTAITPEDYVKLKAANTTFVTAYQSTKRAILDIQAVKKGTPITFSDISSELMIFAGKYAEFKKAFKTLTGGKVAVVFPDESVTLTPGDVSKEIEKIAPMALPEPANKPAPS